MSLTPARLPQTPSEFEPECIAKIYLLSEYLDHSVKVNLKTKQLSSKISCLKLPIDQQNHGNVWEILVTLHEPLYQCEYRYYQCHLLRKELPKELFFFKSLILLSKLLPGRCYCCRSKDLESVCDAAVLQGVGLQAVVTEYLITYADLIFNDKMPSFNGASLQGNGPLCLAGALIQGRRIS